MTQLHDLWKQYDSVWQELIDIKDERREYTRLYRERHPEETDWLKYDLPQAQEILDRLGKLMEQIDPLERDFEKDWEAALGDKIKADHDFAVKAYSALCNVNWEHEDGSRFSCTWRSAGGIIAEIYDGGDYLDFYCSGGEGNVDGEIEEAMDRLGWSHDA